VVYDSNKKTQNFYQGHKLKISAIAKNPYLRIVATGEVNINPQIHVWDAQTMETLVILETSHKGGVLHLVFSTDG
jgi:WD40 repeat protein